MATDMTQAEFEAQVEAEFKARVEAEFDAEVTSAIACNLCLQDMQRIVLRLADPLESDKFARLVSMLVKQAYLSGMRDGMRSAP
ncbi:MAG: hypothetical protein IT518_04320 [Burkholderiales bacterium]|nr:hypothetical protein [Burkholderiales bacterium]